VFNVSGKGSVYGAIIVSTIIFIPSTRLRYEVVPT